MHVDGIILEISIFLLPFLSSSSVSSTDQTVVVSLIPLQYVPFVFVPSLVELRTFEISKPSMAERRGREKYFLVIHGYEICVSWHFS